MVLNLTIQISQYYRTIYFCVFFFCLFCVFVCLFVCFVALSETDHMHILENHLVTVTELLDVSILRPYLRQYRVITEQEHIQLLNNREAPSNTQAELLVCMVKNKGTRGFHRFMAVLQKTAPQHPGHEDLLTLLQSDPTYMRKSHSQFFGSCHSIAIFP